MYENQRQSGIPLILLILAVVLVVHLVVFVYITKDGDDESKTASHDSGRAADVAKSANSQDKISKQPDRRESKPVRTYRVKSDNPRFGTPFVYRKTLSGLQGLNFRVNGTEKMCGIVVDVDSRRVIWEHNSLRQVPIASMTKMMTMLLLFERMDSGWNVNLDSTVAVPKDILKEVPRTGVMYLEPGEKVPLRSLVFGTMIKSANDAAYTCASLIGDGDVAKCVNMMNNRARQLGLKATFTTPNGLKDKSGKNNMGSPIDMVRLGEHLLEYPDVMKACGTQSFTFRENTKKPTTLVNVNRLVNPRWPGVDGMKTGYTRDAGSCLTFSVNRNGRRLIGCVAGFKGAKNRDAFCKKLIDWAYTQPR
ncbi:MAG: D-alanyl-D-alanine carboxypeptidase [Victivallaceae bacterium]|nr:D-alanyl-D-alanine carboxypeptidase [Victivallaceae bacterium]